MNIFRANLFLGFLKSLNMYKMKMRSEICYLSRRINAYGSDKTWGNEMYIHTRRWKGINSMSITSLSLSSRMGIYLYRNKKTNEERRKESKKKAGKPLAHLPVSINHNHPLPLHLPHLINPHRPLNQHPIPIRPLPPIATLPIRPLGVQTLHDFLDRELFF